MADKAHLPQSKHVNLTLSQADELYAVVKSLANEQRLEIMSMLGARSMFVNEIAQQLDIPVSTAANHVRILEEAEVITCEQLPGVRGTMKLCHRRLDSININLIPQIEHKHASLSMSLPVGCYSFAEDIAPTCGLAGAHSAIAEDDNPRSFFHPDRFGAQLLWFRHGYVTYHFSVLNMQDIDIKWLELSFEACSEAPMYRDPWKSDIDVIINGVKVGTWTSPSDCGGRRGLLNPDWWSELSTQYGMLKTWRVDKGGSYLENVPISLVGLRDLKLEEQDHIAVSIGVASGAEHVGGMNLFGKGFGDFAQDVVLRVGYTPRK